jgi:hypothetical protein
MISLYNTITRTISLHRLRPGLQGSLIPFAPLAFVPQRQLLPSGLPSLLVFLLISTDFTPTLEIPTAPITTLVKQFKWQVRS